MKKIKTCPSSDNIEIVMILEEFKDNYYIDKTIHYKKKLVSCYNKEYYNKKIKDKANKVFKPVCIQINQPCERLILEL